MIAREGLYRCYLIIARDVYRKHRELNASRQTKKQQARQQG